MTLKMKRKPLSDCKTHLDLKHAAVATDLSCKDSIGSFLKLHYQDFKDFLKLHLESFQY